MDNTIESRFQELKVAILCSDLKMGQEISNTLRIHGNFAYYYRELKDLWQLLNSESIDLLICDILSINEDGLRLADHPKIAARKVPIAFIFDKLTQSLLSTAYQIGNIGYVYREVSTGHQLSNILLTALELKQLRTNLGQTEHELLALKNKFQNKFEENEEIKKSFGKLKNISEIIREFQKYKINDPQEFLASLGQYFESWKMIKKYSFYQINGSGQKLVSPDLSGHKMTKLPPLWLGKYCLEGIESFAQEMALQVIFDQMGIETILLRLNGAHDRPDILVFFQLHEVYSHQAEDDYQWTIFESLLSNLYKKSLLFTPVDETLAESFISPWDALTFIDEQGKLETEIGYRIANINLNLFNQLIAMKETKEFRWKAFFTDYLLELSKAMKGDVKISSFGTLQVLCMLPSHYFEENYQRLKSFVQKFEYWRYFTREDIIFSPLDYPSVSLVNPSSIFYLKKYVLKILPTPITKSSLHENTL